ncbi:MAG: cysteine--tRNA ligase [Candidatus Woesearchaeota archaeon]|nr:MAG: cysteine--tRNA ligase [Candidatus Woesearchaeota archaeon]
MSEKIQLFNTLGKEKQEFIPLNKGQVRMYSCGPTVYSYIHIGNHRHNLVDDFLKRMFLFNKYEVIHIINITDVGHLTSDADEGEDKMEKAARKEQKSPLEIAEYYTQSFFDDLAQLNIIPATQYPRATAYIAEQIEMIKELEKKGYTYHAGGNVYFDTEKFPEYGSLTNKQHTEAYSRTGKDPNKKNSQDFVLWFTKSKYEHHAQVWDSPWGTGYPGWHIECSTMSRKLLGDQFDIHTGGVDLQPVHHENEIAQSNCAIGKRAVNYWVHNEFLVVGKEKMAKSSGGFLTLANLKKEGFDPLDFRYLCLLTHYRKQLQYSTEALVSARNAVKNIRKRLSTLPKENKTADAASIAKFRTLINDDLNLPQAVALLQEVLQEGSENAYATILEMDKVFGLCLDKEEQLAIPQEVRELLNKRTIARKEKNWKESDTLRDLILAKGYKILDSSTGTTVEKI